MTTPTSLDAPALAALLAGPRPPVLIDVRLDTDFACTRLPGARNNCVFEVAFTERIAELETDRIAPVCVYGAAAGSLESRMAAEKLCRMGFTEVYDLRGGIEEWSAAGLPVERKSANPSGPEVLGDGIYPMDLSESHVHWIGRNLLNRHEGEIALKSGWLKIEGGHLTAGEFVLDMTSIRCRDLAGDSLHDVLIHHLLSHDFFDASVYPEATYVISTAAGIPDATPGAPNLTISGTLTLKQVSSEVGFTACTGITAEGKPAAQASFAIDRTRWNVFYGSGKWFHRLGAHLVNDLIELQVRIVGA